MVMVSLLGKGAPARRSTGLCPVGAGRFRSGTSVRRGNGARLQARAPGWRDAPAERMRMAARPEDLCLDCGLCCDGSLFWAVPVAAVDPAPVPRDAEGRLRQPCPRFDGRCTIYAERPAACRAFDCRVLQIVRAGHRDPAWGRAQIAGMRQLLARLDALLPGGAEASIYRRAAEYIARHRDDFDDPAFQRRNRSLLRCLSDYEAALARFHVAPKPAAR